MSVPPDSVFHALVCLRSSEIKISIANVCNSVIQCIWSIADNITIHYAWRLRANCDLNVRFVRIYQRIILRKLRNLSYWKNLCLIIIVIIIRCKVSLAIASNYFKRDLSCSVDLTETRSYLEREV